ncbi:hypothetical protein [Mesorhizobium sp. YR577]|jgi:hypothetical protein|uniref:hypothetical protein n=1 Tax=Mesorhizobium sp. YR577 TaxID=1884373 RepID=UPI0008E41B37|nr:hypothetical protein [Mesorhizobium sp. YR577]SFU17225.1 hypothetical protein SAMN05518861_11796 [Mesorhizobium sp. YR577]
MTWLYHKWVSEEPLAAVGDLLGTDWYQEFLRFVALQAMFASKNMVLLVCACGSHVNATLCNPIEP